jgi:hypothetical protein
MEVRRLGFGAMRLTGPGMWGEFPDCDAGIALLRRALWHATRYRQGSPFHVAGKPVTRLHRNDPPTAT